nr:xylulose kinase-1 [Tanacetum cinerariifolium]
MADFAFAPQQNMVSYLEKTEGNAEFHQIVDFLTSSSIHHALTIYAIVDGKTIVITESSVRRDLLFTDDNGITCLTNAQIFKNLPLTRGDSLVRAATTASLDTQQDNSNIAKTQSKTTLNGEGLGSGPGCQETMRGVMAQIRPEGAPIQSSDPHLNRDGTSRRHSLGRRNVSKQERKNLKSQQKFQDIDDLVDEGSTSESVSTARPDISTARLKVSTAKPKTPPTTTTLFDDEDVTIADTLVMMKSQKAKEKGVAFKDVNDSARPIRYITTLQPLLTIDPKDKDLDEEVKTKRERQEEASKAALAELYDEVQAQIDADLELAARLTHKEQEKYTVEESNTIMASLQLCDYHNMVAILEKSKHKVDFHPMVDFIEASPLRYALTVKPTVYISHIRQFWSTARIETTEEGTQILATVDGILRTVTESSLRQNLKLQDEEGIRFNEFSSNIATALVCLATNRTYNFSKMIFDGLVKNVNNKGEGSDTPTDPHHTPFPMAQPPSHTTHSSSTLLPVTTTSIHTVTPSETTPIRQYTRRARIAQSSTLPTIADEPESLLRDVTPRVTSPTADEGSMQQTINELTALCTSLQRQYSKLAVKFEAQEIEITSGAAEVPTGSGSIPTAGPPAVEVPTGSDVVPTASLVFATATVITPYRRRKGK